MQSANSPADFSVSLKDDKRWKLGDVAYDADNYKYQFVYADVAMSVGAACGHTNNSFGHVTTTSGSYGQPAGISMCAVTLGSYCWIMKEGLTSSLAIASSTAAAAPLMMSATAGCLIPAVVSTAGSLALSQIVAYCEVDNTGGTAATIRVAL